MRGTIKPRRIVHRHILKRDTVLDIPWRRQPECVLDLGGPLVVRWLPFFVESVGGSDPHDLLLSGPPSTISPQRTRLKTSFVASPDQSFVLNGIHVSKSGPGAVNELHQMN